MTCTWYQWYLDGAPLRRSIRKRLAKKWEKSGRLRLKETVVEMPDTVESVTGELLRVTQVDGNVVTLTRGTPDA